MHGVEKEFESPTFDDLQERNDVNTRENPRKCMFFIFPIVSPSMIDDLGGQYASLWRGLADFIALKKHTPRYECDLS